MIVLKDALDIKDGRILSVPEPKIHSHNCLRKATAKQELELKKSLIIQNSL